ncbi:phospholipid-binding protein MlaC [Bisgaard Taxon 10/6]|uniref:phospholipid-binding protein MlaC n=1 Tax=Exercitatus varius TaxID=67857 RepID=UPI0018A410B0|nr:phospholipid-binding protein MlaC [Exercitatus varius]MDG2953796.1 phospholipid-binding protein MlaC [Exercitatus varius]MDG2960951.1 phospholipid-binding protein MlaC [Exercitatus varius]MDG2961826.1 phospholipid-binding protein MlaC [Exercitatus varius]QOF68952.1 phospholipid-binding protein MlaC [Actinobacillus sp. GY-402]
MMKLLFKTWLSKMVVLATALLAVQTVTAAEGPYELTQRAADKLFADLKSNNAAIKSNPNMLKNIVRNDLMPYVHVNYAGSLVLGQYFRSTTPQQRETFFAAFDKFIEQAYAQALTMYNGQDVQVQKAQLNGDSQASVKVKLIQAQPLNLTFQWRKNSKTGQWQVYDMTAEGVSMVETKKQEWSNILRKEGIDALTAQVQKAAAVPVTFSKK